MSACACVKVCGFFGSRVWNGGLGYKGLTNKSMRYDTVPTLPNWLTDLRPIELWRVKSALFLLPRPQMLLLLPNLLLST